MQWTDQGIVLGLRAFGENSSIVTVLCENHGKHMGLVRGARSKTARATLQAGNLVRVTWTARLEDHLGVMTCELIDGFGARAIASKTALGNLNCLCDTIDSLLSERDKQKPIFQSALTLLENLNELNIFAVLYAHWEIAVLETLGYGLDLSKCAQTNQRDELIYVSPKSGRAVSRTAGEPYHDKLLKLPNFLLVEDFTPPPEDIYNALILSGYFLDKIFWSGQNKQYPAARTRLVDRIKRMAKLGTD